ncbi:hypothetical protein PG984_004722 [Apiospora sp. TS-2023a]
MYTLFKATRRSLSAPESSLGVSSVSPEWRVHASNRQRAATVMYLRQRGRALLEACHGRVEDLSKASLEEHLDRLLDVDDEPDFAARADRLTATFAFRFEAMRLATEVLRDDMRDYHIGLPGSSPCIGWDEAMWKRMTVEAQGAQTYAERKALVERLMDNMQLNEMGPPFRPGLGQGWSFSRPLRYLAAALVGSEIPARELPATVRNLAKACRARALGGSIEGEEEEEEDDDDDEDDSIEEMVADDVAENGRVQGVSKIWGKTVGLFKKTE